MAPGRRWRPVASNVSRAVGIARFSPMARIWPSLIATAAWNEAVSVTIVAPEITRSAIDVVGFVISLGPFVGVVVTSRSVMIVTRSDPIECCFSASPGPPQATTIRPRHSQSLDNEPMPPELHPQTLGNPSDSARIGYALGNLGSRRDKAPEIDRLHFFCRETTGDRMTNQDVQ